MTFKVFYDSWHFKTPQIFLDYLKPLSPNNDGCWKDMIPTLNPLEANYYVIFDGLSRTLPNMKEKALFFCLHPKVDNYAYGTKENLSRSFKEYNNVECLKFFNSYSSILNPVEWWLSANYEELKSINIFPIKPKKLCYIVTYQTHNPMYAQRIKFAEALVDSGIEFDLYGRPEEKFKTNSKLAKVYKGALGNNNPDGQNGNHKIGKDSILAQYKYSIEIDVGPTMNYCSERFADAILTWTKPFYFGSLNLDHYFPKDSFININIINIPLAIEQIKYELDQKVVNYAPIEEARNLILDKYQVFPCVYEAIKELKK